ncbi:MAG TPA: hypothetical protein VKJ77_07275, partial [Caballeronia sp.]|nr:hypothetical protein [Caballeronia sp.]
TAIARATFAATEKYPAFATYHLHEVFHNGKGNDSVFDDTIKQRLGDGRAIFHNQATHEEAARNDLHMSPKAVLLGSPTLRGFFSYTLLGTRFLFGTTESRTYAEAPTNADTVSRSLRGFSVAFAPDATPQAGHLIFTPVTDDTRNASAHLTDVYYTPSTLMPTHIVFEGPGNTVYDRRFEIIDGQLVGSGVYARHTFSRVALFAQVTVESNISITDCHFSNDPPDKRLAFPSEIAVAPSLLGDYIGTYQMATTWRSTSARDPERQGPAVNLVIAEADGHLTLSVGGNQAVRLLAETPSKFFYKSGFAEIGFFRDATTNTVARLVLYQGDYQREGTLVR